MTTDAELREKEVTILYLDRENQKLRVTLLDGFAQAALASGRYAHNQVYQVAQQCLEERSKYVGP